MQLDGVEKLLSRMTSPRSALRCLSSNKFKTYEKELNRLNGEFSDVRGDVMYITSEEVRDKVEEVRDTVEQVRDTTAQMRDTTAQTLDILQKILVPSLVPACNTAEVEEVLRSPYIKVRSWKEDTRCCLACHVSVCRAGICIIPANRYCTALYLPDCVRPYIFSPCGAQCLTQDPSSVRSPPTPVGGTPGGNASGSSSTDHPVEVTANTLLACHYSHVTISGTMALSNIQSSDLFS